MFSGIPHPSGGCGILFSAAAAGRSGQAAPVQGGGRRFCPRSPGFFQAGFRGGKKYV